MKRRVRTIRTTTRVGTVSRKEVEAAVKAVVAARGTGTSRLVVRDRNSDKNTAPVRK